MRPITTCSCVCRTQPAAFCDGIHRILSDNPSGLGWVKRSVCVTLPGRTTIAVIGFTQNNPYGDMLVRQQDRTCR